jgi:hypothetical protein
MKQQGQAAADEEAGQRLNIFITYSTLLSSLTQPPLL